MSQWPMASLPDVAEIIMGQSPPGDTYNATGAGLPFFQGKTEFGEVSPTARKWCTDPKRTAEAGDILMSVRAPVGPTNLANIRCCIGRGLAAIRAKSDVLDPGYLRFALRHAEPKLASMGQGSTFAAIGRAELASTSFLLPPLPEQRRIVDLLSRAEGIVRLRREAEKKAAELIPALFNDMFGDPATNPKGWPVAKVGALLVEPPTLGTMAKPSNTVGKWLDLRVANIQGGQLTLADKKWLDLPDSQVARFALRSGDVVLARAIGSLDHLGKAVVLHPDGDWTFDSHLMRLRFDSAKLLPQVFKAFLESTSGREVFLKHTRRSAVQFNINGKEIRQIEIAVPPMALQQSFWERAEEVRSIQSQQSTATAKAQATFDALLADAFKAG